MPPPVESKPPKLFTDDDFLEAAKHFWPDTKGHRVVGAEVVCLNPLEQTVVASKDAVQNRLNAAWPVRWPPGNHKAE